MSLIQTDNGLYSSGQQHPVVLIEKIVFAGATMQNGIYRVNDQTVSVITADMISPVEELQIPAGEMTVMLGKMVQGQVVDEIPFVATITAADGETPAQLTLRLKLPWGFYELSAERLNRGLANPKINAPFRLAFDTLDIDCVVAV